MVLKHGEVNQKLQRIKRVQKIELALMMMKFENVLLYCLINKSVPPLIN